MRHRLVAVAVGALIAAGCATGTRRPPVATVPDPPPAATRRAAETVALGHRLVADALDLRGVPYRNGGLDPRGFDCSGLVAYVFARHGVRVPRETTAQFSTGVAVKRGDLQPGDLVFFSTVGPGASHVGIAVNADEFVHAPSSQGVVRVERLSLPYWQRRYIGARRVR